MIDLMQPSEAMPAILNVVARHHELSVADILSKSRKAHLVRARRAVALLLVGLGISQSEIARFFGMHPSSVNHLVRT